MNFNLIKPYLTKWFSKIVLKVSSPDIKSCFRNIEKLKLKIIRLECHRSFNETCLLNGLLPTYTNVRLHDEVAHTEAFVTDFKMKLIKRQISEQSDSISSTKNEYNLALLQFQALLRSDLKYDAFLLFLEKTSDRVRHITSETQHNKLVRMYGASILQKQTKDSVVNLSSVNIDEEMRDIFALGMNCHLKQKFDYIKKRVNVELLYERICDLSSSKSIVVGNDEVLRSELERFGLRRNKSFESDLLTRDQYDKVKKFASDPSIVIRKADKSNIFVILDRKYYDDEIQKFLSDTTKFSKIDKDPTDTLKREINICISNINRAGGHKFYRREGKYEPGYIYGNPKIHKRLVDPPLRPIISQVGTVTYNISKELNSIISPYIPKRFSITSTLEFLKLLPTNATDGCIMASLDVESLFTNVPVSRTIDIIIDNVYGNPNKQPPNIPAEEMRKLLTICTTKTPFSDASGNLYVQSEGCSMGSALGPTFSEFYMCHLENYVFDNAPDLKPLVYARYVDDCFLLVNDVKQIDHIRHLFEINSVLKFTHELEKSKQLPFLDSLISIKNNKLQSSVYVKPTNFGDCINYNSICPDRYKTGVIKTLLHRGYHISSSWELFTTEIDRIKQLLTNNNFPMNIIDKTVQEFVNKLHSTELPIAAEKIKLYYESQMCSNYKIEEKQLRHIISNNIKPSVDDAVISLEIFYKNKKLRNLLIRNKPPKTNNDISERHGVVYRYTCNKEGCNASQTYIGYTACTISERFKMHAVTGSIKSHVVQAHNINKIPKTDLIQCVDILRQCSSRRELIMTEAILIKDMKPSLNSQQEGCERLLKVFKHP